MKTRLPILMYAGMVLFIGDVQAQSGRVNRQEGDKAACARIAAGLRPYRGPSKEGIDRSTLTGKVMCGYQGWFGAEGDGARAGWLHWQRKGRFKPGFCSVDMWPDVSELDEDEKFATAFRHRDGSTAHVFSSYQRKTVVRHFKWMKEYGIDGAFVQRFARPLRDPVLYARENVVLAHCREGSNLHGRAFAVMYDLSGLRAKSMSVVMDDWKALVDNMRITRDRAYLNHGGKPVVAVWGIGFNEGAKYTLEECGRLVDFLSRDGKYGGNTVMLGVPTGWRELTHDALPDKKLHAGIGKGDIVSPWAVGRFGSPGESALHADRYTKGDVAWCKENGKEYLPVVFPGFSWSNMHAGREKLNHIPRLRGEFLWSQFVQCKKAGATMIYQAMFDEVDEGTAIFKCTNDPPVGPTKFVTHEGLPSDHYLWLVGTAARMLRGEIPLTEKLPDREK